jgi:hypothetical protein
MVNRKVKDSYMSSYQRFKGTKINQKTAYFFSTLSATKFYNLFENQIFHAIHRIRTIFFGMTILMEFIKVTTYVTYNLLTYNLS